ncbi:MAG: hypothetical protein AABX01_05575 [Candidatus Micrarchaeota archaeon]
MKFAALVVGLVLVAAAIGALNITANVKVIGWELSPGFCAKTALLRTSGVVCNVTIQNRNNFELLLTAKKSGNGSRFLKVDNRIEIAPQSAKTLPIEFRATKVGGYEGTIIFSDKERFSRNVSVQLTVIECESSSDCRANQACNLITNTCESSQSRGGFLEIIISSLSNIINSFFSKLL